MVKRRKINKKGQLLLVGLFFLLIGISVMIYTPIKTIKNKVFSEMKLAIYQDEINEDNLSLALSKIEKLNKKDSLKTAKENTIELMVKSHLKILR